MSTATSCSDGGGSCCRRWWSKAESSTMVPVEIARDGDRPRRTDRDGVIEIVLAEGCGCVVAVVLPEKHAGQDRREYRYCGSRCGCAITGQSMIAWVGRKSPT